MSRYLVSFLENADRISMRPRTMVVNGDGDTRLRQLTLEQLDSGEREVVPADALFVMIGADPHTGWLPPEIARDEHGFLLTGPDVVGAGAAAARGRWSGCRSASRPACPACSPPATSARTRSSASRPPSARAPSPCGSCSSTWRPAGCVRPPEPPGRRTARPALAHAAMFADSPVR